MRARIDVGETKPGHDRDRSDRRAPAAAGPPAQRSKAGLPAISPFCLGTIFHRLNVRSVQPWGL